MKKKYYLLIVVVLSCIGLSYILLNIIEKYNISKLIIKEVVKPYGEIVTINDFLKEDIKNVKCNQDLDTITIKGFGLTKEGKRRSDVQSMTSLIKRGNDFEVINMRRDLSSSGEWEDIFYYSKTTLHLQQRSTFMNICAYPLQMDGNTIIYGGKLSGKKHTQLTFTKHLNAKTEHDIEVIVKALMN